MLASSYYYAINKRPRSKPAVVSLRARAFNLTEPEILRVVENSKIEWPVISLTTHGDRIFNVHNTIQSLLKQHLVKKIVLYVTQETFDRAPACLLSLINDVFKIHVTEDLGPATKLLPAMDEFPDRPIITVDDDCEYTDKNMYIRLFLKHISQPDVIVSNITGYHYVSFTRLCDYAEGYSGVLYPAHIFNPEVRAFIDRNLEDVGLKYHDDLLFFLAEIKHRIRVVPTVTYRQTVRDFGIKFTKNDKLDNLRQTNLHKEYDMLVNSIARMKTDETYHIAYVVNDDRYFNKCLIPSVNSVMMNNPFFKIHFHVYTLKDLPPMNCDIKFDAWKEFEYTDIRKLIEDMGNKITVEKLDIADEDYHNYPYLVKFKLQELLTGRVLYLDSDTICLGNLEELFKTDLTGYQCAAVTDAGIATNRFPADRVAYEIGFDNYFNAGVILFDFDEIHRAYRNRDFTAEAKARYDKHPDKLKFFDQDILNSMFAGKVKLVDWRYNCIDLFCRDRAISDVVILHFASEHQWILEDRYEHSPHIKWLLHYRSMMVC